MIIFILILGWLLIGALVTFFGVKLMAFLYKDSQTVSICEFAIGTVLGCFMVLILIAGLISFLWDRKDYVFMEVDYREKNEN